MEEKTVLQVGKTGSVRIPKAALKECGIDEEMELEVINGIIVLKAVDYIPRKGWDEAFLSMKQKRDDRLLIQEENKHDLDDWEW